eukprot:15366161-Ditylum_brightwellii.AAC.2
MKSDTSSFDDDSVNDTEIQFAGGIKIEVTTDIPSFIMGGVDGADGKEELNRNIKNTSLDIEISSIDIHEVNAMLLEIVTGYSIPIEGYKSLMQWAEVMSKSNYVARNPVGYHTKMRKITTSASYACNMPKSESITIRYLPPATVYKFPFFQNTKRSYLSEVLMKDSMWSYDEINTNYADVKTGSCWKGAKEEMKDMLNKKGVDNQRNHFIALVVFFINSTHCDQNGKPTTEPVLCTVGKISIEKRKQYASWFILGLLPSSILTPAEKKEMKKGYGCLELYHQSLAFILEELLDLQSLRCQSGYGHQVFVHGQGKLNLCFEVATVLGDIMGHDAMCCHYKSYTNKIAHPICSCNMDHRNMNNPHSNCSPVHIHNLYNNIEN